MKSTSGCLRQIGDYSLGYQNHKEQKVNNINTVNGIEKITLYPNPTSGVFKINIPAKSKLKSVEITSYTGQIIYTRKFKDYEVYIVEIDLSDQNPGMYFVNIISDKIEKRLKIIKL